MLCAIAVPSCISFDVAFINSYKCQSDPVLVQMMVMDSGAVFGTRMDRAVSVSSVRANPRPFPCHIDLCINVTLYDHVSSWFADRFSA